MKKHFNSWGILFLYLIFIFGLDRIYLDSGINPIEFIMINGYSIVDLYIILFSIGSLVFIYFSITKSVNDKYFHIIQLVLGIFGAFYPYIWKIVNLYNLSFGIFPSAYLFGSKLGILRIAFTFIGGLGVIGLLRKGWKR